VAPTTGGVSTSFFEASIHPSGQIGNVPENNIVEFTEEIKRVMAEYVGSRIDLDDVALEAVLPEIVDIGLISQEIRGNIQAASQECVNVLESPDLTEQFQVSPCLIPRSLPLKRTS
jgi:hypothetical protein